MPYGYGGDHTVENLSLRCAVHNRLLAEHDYGAEVMARHRGSEVHDPIHFVRAQADSPSLGFVRPTNNAGGLEAGDDTPDATGLWDQPPGKPRSRMRRIGLGLRWS